MCHPLKVKMGCCKVPHRWVNIDQGQMRTFLAQQHPEAHNGPTELTQKQFVWLQQPSRQLLVRGQFKEPCFCLLCSRCLPVRGWAAKENKSSSPPDVCISMWMCAFVCGHVYMFVSLRPVVEISKYLIKSKWNKNCSTAFQLKFYGKDVYTSALSHG